MSNALTALFNVEKPIIQAPMAGVQDYRLAAAVSNAGGLGSLPCAMLGTEALREELKALNEATSKPYNLNFFAHTPPEPNPQQEASWQQALAPYYKEFGIDPASITAGPGRSEEHTSELQSRPHLVCRLLLEKKKPAHEPI